MLFEELIAAICEETGIEEAAPDGDGACSFLVDDQELSVISMQQGHRCGIVAAIGQVPANPDSRLLRLLLQFNYLYAGGQGATMALGEGEEGQTLYLQRSDSLADLADRDQWLGILDNFIALVHHWRGLLAQHAQDGGAADTDAAPQESEPVSGEGATLNPESWLAV